MRSLPRFWPLLLILLAMLAVPAWARAGAANTKNPNTHNNSPKNPLAPPGNAKQVRHSQQDFATYPLIVKHIVQLGGIQGNIAATQTVEGPLTRHTYQVAGGPTAAAISKAYAKRLTGAGFKLLFQCQGQQCGPDFVRASPGFRADDQLFDTALASQHYLAAQRTSAAGASDVYVAVQTAALSGKAAAIQVDQIKVKPRQISAISVNAAAMARQIEHRGRAMLYGIYFAFDSARLKPASKPTLAQIAQLLHNKPKLRLLVVGHTDNRGPFNYNIDLSKRRARAVVDALVDHYGIDRDRLKPWGDGYTEPRASNATGVGRAKNRRVELVSW